MTTMSDSWLSVLVCEYPDPRIKALACRAQGFVPYAYLKALSNTDASEVINHTEASARDICAIVWSDWVQQKAKPHRQRSLTMPEITLTGDES